MRCTAGRWYRHLPNNHKTAWEGHESCNVQLCTASLTICGYLSLSHGHNVSDYHFIILPEKSVHTKRHLNMVSTCIYTLFTGGIRRATRFIRACIHHGSAFYFFRTKMIDMYGWCMREISLPDRNHLEGVASDLNGTTYTSAVPSLTICTRSSVGIGMDWGVLDDVLLPTTSWYLQVHHNNFCVYQDLRPYLHRKHVYIYILWQTVRDICISRWKGCDR